MSLHGGSSIAILWLLLPLVTNDSVGLLKLRQQASYLLTCTHLYMGVQVESLNNASTRRLCGYSLPNNTHPNTHTEDRFISTRVLDGGTESVYSKQACVYPGGPGRAADDEELDVVRTERTEPLPHAFTKGHGQKQAWLTHTLST